MRVQPVTTDRSVLGSAGRAAGFALASSALAAVQHHAVTDSAVSWPAVVVATVAVFVCSIPALHARIPRAAALAAVAVQALLPAWLEATDTAVAAADMDGHLRLPPVWHHNTPAMAALNVLASLALARFLQHACALPEYLTHAAAGCAREWARHMLAALLLRLPLTGRPVAAYPRPPVPTAPPPTRALAGLLHHVVRCGP